MPSQARISDTEHLLHSWSSINARAGAPVVVGGEGAWFWDEDGNRFLDFSSQLVNVNIGHQHPKLVAAIQEQAAKLCTIGPNLANDQRSEAARLVAEVAPGDLDVVFFTNSGAEATENAIRMARLHTGRSKIFSFYRSYHGSTHGSITLTGEPRRWASEPGIPGVVHFMGPYLYRSSFNATTEQEECERALAHLEEVLMYEGAHNVAGIIMEPVVGTNGVLVPPDGYLQGVREICNREGIVMIADEVMAGFGRTGEWFAVDNWSVVPDLLTFAKGVNSGYLPLGGVIMRRHVAESFRDKPYMGGLTYGAHVLACASAVASINIFKEEKIVEHAQVIGQEVLGPQLRALQDRHASVGEVRGLGAFWAIELVKDKTTREALVPFNAAGPAAKPMAEVTAALKQRGLWPFVIGNRIHVTPPLVITPEEARQGIAIIDEALAVADAYAGG